jgi:PAS domain S-box-containing protein
MEAIAPAMVQVLLRKRAEEALRKAHDELELRVRQRTAELSTANEDLREQAALLDLAHDAILVRSVDGKIRYWNDGAEKTYGWTRLEALGKTTNTLLRPHFPRPLDDLMADLLRDGEWEGELGHRTKSGERITVASRWALQKGPEGSPTGMLEINRDISLRKRAEEQVKSYMAKLEESNQALQDFASIASHDLQEPLRKVSAFGSMLKQKCGGSLDEQGSDYLERMLNANQRMQSLLAALLEYARLSTRVDPFVDVELSKTVHEVLSDLEVRIKKTGGEVRVEALPVIQADPIQMRQLFQNLIGNALKFCETGKKPIVQVRSVSNTGSECQIVVEDNGIGFEERFLEKIFAPFQRLHGRSSHYEGTGMGLAICKKIVERHGGSITAKSAPGEGAAFIVKLPLRNQDRSRI